MLLFLFVTKVFMDCPNSFSDDNDNTEVCYTTSAQGFTDETFLLCFHFWPVCSNKLKFNYVPKDLPVHFFCYFDNNQEIFV